MNDRVLLIKDVMATAHVSKSTVLRWLKGTLAGTPKLTATKIGRRWIILESDLSAALKSRREPVDTSSPISLH